MSRNVSDNTSLLRLLPEGRYVGHGHYSDSEQVNQRPRLEASFTLSHTEIMLVLEGSVTLPKEVEHGFKLELELARNEAGKGYFVFRFAQLAEIVGVLGNVDGGVYLLAGRSKTPPTQLSCRLMLVDERTLSLEGLLAYEDFKWVTWTLSVKSYDPQKALDAVVSLPRRR